MTHGLSNGHVTDDAMWPPKVLWGSTVGYPSDSLLGFLSLATSGRLSWPNIDFFSTCQTKLSYHIIPYCDSAIHQQGEQMPSMDTCELNTDADYEYKYW